MQGHIFILSLVAFALCSSSDDFCSDKKDGLYPKAGFAFEYIQCAGGKRLDKACPENMVYQPNENSCVHMKEESEKDFCKFRNNGDWQDPFDCHQFYKCYMGSTYKIPCQLPQLVFNPHHDACEYKNKYACKEIKPQLNEYNDNFCENREDGNYSTYHDVFTYVSCKNHVGTIKNCHGDDIYDDAQRHCVSSDSLTKDNFCRGRGPSQYRDPWDCHKFISCSHNELTEHTCPVEDMVYNPNTNQCDYPFNFPCKEMERAKEDIECKGKANGNYSIPDVFVYLICKDGDASYGDCPSKFIFDNAKLTCVTILRESLDSFCLKRPDGDWADPWNCNSYIECNGGQSTRRPCQINGLVFNPYEDVCVEPGVAPMFYPCKQANMELLDNPCKGKADGNYMQSDAFDYLQCKNGSGKVLSCSNNQYFDHVSGKCVNGSTYTLAGFCKAHKDGVYQNLLDCHSTLSCVAGRPLVQKCYGSLVYNPVTQQCVENYKCRQLATKEYGMDDKQANIELFDNPCKGKADGNYMQSDAFDYLQCKNGSGKVLSCTNNQYFDHVSGKCVNGSTYTLAGFCKAHKDGVYQNLLDCHSTLSCVAGRPLVQKCYGPLVYNPVTQQCVENYQCRQLTAKEYETKDRFCSGKKNGIYPVADAFSYLRCKNETGKILSCGSNKIFDHVKNKCIDGTGYNTSKFCSQHEDGVYQNLLNCHGYVSCVAKSAYEMSCHPKSLVYDPYFKRCEFASQYPCKQLKPKSVVDKQCQGLGDGKYNVPDIFSYFECKNGQATNKTCATNYIFDPKKHDCVEGKTLSKENFCKDRTTGNYQNPWNCHGYISCVHGSLIERDCPIKSLVYDPYKDICEFETKYKCRALKSGSSSIENVVLTKNVNIKDVCLTLKDGYYATRDVFHILHCVNHTSNYIACPKDTLYGPGNGDKCVPKDQVNIGNFCENRTVGNWQNPWDCHSFISCDKHHQYHNRTCSLFVELNYDPVNDICEYPSIRQCYQLSKAHYHLGNLEPVKVQPSLIFPALNRHDSFPMPCLGKKDGRYAIRDVAVMMVCRQEKATYVQCKKGEIYVPTASDCTDIGHVNMGNFCVGRSDGNWRNPWNCHDYVTCHLNRAFDRPCSIRTTLNYDPYKDLCDYPRAYKCVNITSAAYY